MSNLIDKNSAYIEWLSDVSKRFRQTQIKAAVAVNSGMLQFYWEMGRDISTMYASARYGSAFYKTLSADLRKLLPDVKSFSPTNLKYMKAFYELYSDAEIRQQLADESEATVVVRPIEIANIFLIPWGHHILIMSKCKKDIDKALFYVRKTVENNWSRSMLRNFLDTDLYEREGKAVTNFSDTLPDSQSDLAQEIIKDPYNFDFLALTERYNEREFKDALIDKVENFLIELGTGFAFMGREVRLEVGETEKFADMLFYNVRLHCYVVVEVKTGKFDASHAGQLGTYVVAVNHLLKSEDDNPTLGLLVCKDMDKVEASFALESSSQPLGVSTYELTKLVPDEFRGSMPSIEEIEAELS